MPPIPPAWEITVDFMQNAFTEVGSGISYELPNDITIISSQLNEPISGSNDYATVEFAAKLSLTANELQGGFLNNGRLCEF